MNKKNLIFELINFLNHYPKNNPTLFGFEEDEEIPETCKDYNPPEEPKKKKKKFSRRDLITLSFLKDLKD